MTFLDVLHTYFEGERSYGLYWIAPMGVALLLLAGLTWFTQEGGFRVGLAIPTLLFGLLLSGVGVGLGVKTPAQVDELVAAYEADSAAMVAEELPRMRAVNSRWIVFLGTWLSLIVVGVGLRFGLKADWAHGLGVALVLIGALGLIVDTMSEERAVPYTAALEAEAGS